MNEKNTILRQAAKNEFEKNYYKLGNNSVFGKTMENVRKHGKCELVFSEKRFQKLIRQLQYKSHNIVNDDTVIVERYKNNIKLNKPVYAGAAILQHSKLQIYGWFHDYFKQKYGDNCSLIYSDTDSLIMHITTDDIYGDMICDKDRFDMSGYAKNYKTLKGNNLFDKTNAKVLSKIKDETSGHVISEICAIRSKNYSYVTDKTYSRQFTYINEKGKPINWDKFDSEHKKIKGVQHSIVDALSHDDFTDTVINGKTTICNISGFRSFNHQIYTVDMRKKALQNFDDKRNYLTPTLSVPHGYNGEKYRHLL